MNKFYSLLVSLILATFFVGSLSAQFYVTDRYFDPTGVSNDGVVVGVTGKNEPFQLWFP